ncbi:MAG: GGDEF domain-containing protein [Nitrospirae bacterium]|nr:GGDEF domain-containing protein [Nitrospirota bacterium]
MILARLRKVIHSMSSVLKLAQMAAMGIDYSTFGQYVLNISKLRDIDGILREASNCLKDILDYELFGFAVSEANSISLWVDPRIYRERLIQIIEKDFGRQFSDIDVHYLTGIDKTGRRQNIDDVSIISFPVVEGAVLYIAPGKRMKYYHVEIIGVIIKTIASTLDNADKMRQLERAATIDSLTGCYNRRALSGIIEHEAARAERHSAELSVVMFDLDHFKQVNDNFGHAAGDEVLREVSKAVLNMVRKSDYAARYGGEEFLLVLPDTSTSMAVELAERLRCVIEGLKITVGSDTINVTSSFGVAGFKRGLSGDRLIREADAMLYKAKIGGRNMVMPTGYGLMEAAA